MTIPELNQRILGLALQHIGVREEPGPRKNNPEILAMFTSAGASWVSKDEVAWCSAFACYIAELAGAANPRTIRARRWLELAHADRIDSIDDLVPGDLVVLWRGAPSSTQGHVAVFLGRQRGARTDLLWLLGGNQRDTVCPAAYPANQFLAGLRLHAANDVPFDEEVDRASSKVNHHLDPDTAKRLGELYPEAKPASTGEEPANTKPKGKKKRATRKKGAKASE